MKDFLIYYPAFERKYIFKLLSMLVERGSPISTNLPTLAQKDCTVIVMTKINKHPMYKPTHGEYIYTLFFSVEKAAVAKLIWAILPRCYMTLVGTAMITSSCQEYTIRSEHIQHALISPLA